MRLWLDVPAYQICSILRILERRSSFESLSIPRLLSGRALRMKLKALPLVRLVDGIGDYHAGGAVGGRPSDGDAKGAHDERLVELLQVGIARLHHDGAERVTRLLEYGGDVSQFGHDEGGRSARRVVRLI